MNYMNKTWKRFDLIMLFDMYSGKYISKNCYTDGSTPLVSATNLNNGVKNYIDLKAAFEAGSITIGKVSASAFYQDIPFCATGDVTVLYPKFKINKEIGLFITTLLKLEEKKWCYGRQIRLGDCKKLKIMLPVDINNNPDWLFIEDFIKTIDVNKILNLKASHKKSNITLPKFNEWMEFKYSDLFNIVKGKRLTKENSNYGNTVYLSSKDNNNNFDRLIDLDPIYHKNTLTVNSNGSVGSAFYHEYEYWASDNTNVLVPKFHLNKYIGLFLTTIIEKEKYRFGYGRLWNTSRMNNTILRLPVTELGEPDWNLMELYMKSLPYSEYI